MNYNLKIKLRISPWDVVTQRNALGEWITEAKKEDK